MRRTLTRISISHIKGPRLPNLLPKALSVDEIDSFFLQRKKLIKSWIDYRDLALFELAYSSGLRVSELVSIDDPPGKRSLGSLSLEKMEVEVLGKGAKWRRLPIGEKAKDAIEVWLEYRQRVLFDKKVYLKRVNLFLLTSLEKDCRLEAFKDDLVFIHCIKLEAICYSAHVEAFIRQSHLTVKQKFAGRPGASGTCQCYKHSNLHKARLSISIGSLR